MLTGVCAESSASTNDGWLSDEACLVGISRLGVPARLMGLEKLRDGRGRADESEATDGDRWNELMAGDGAALARPTLAADGFRESWE